MTFFRSVFHPSFWRLLLLSLVVGACLYFAKIQFPSIEHRSNITFNETNPEDLIERYDTLVRSNLVPRPAQHYRSKYEPTLVFTCLGERGLHFQNYLIVSLTQARRTNPTVRIVLILNRANFAKVTVVSGISINGSLRDLSVIPVFYEDLTKSSGLLKEFQKLFFIQGDMVPEGNSQFVQFTTERLIIIYEYMAKNNLKNVFHMENDNMLYANLKALSRRMCACSVTFAMPKASTAHAIASFVFIHDAWAIEQFVRWCIEVFRLGRQKAISYLGTIWINDMTLGARYLDLRASTLYQTELTGVAMLPAQFYDGKNGPCLWSPPSKEIVRCGGSSTNAVERDRIIFDACVLGQWFGGIHTAPGSQYWLETRLVDPRKKTIEWRKDPIDGLKRPFIDNISVINLHIHSKQLEKFSSTRND